MRNRTLLGVIVSLVWTSAGCTSGLAKTIKTGFEHPKTTVDRQFEAVQQSLRSLGGLGSANVFATFASGELVPHLTRELKRAYPQVTSIAVRGAEQELVTDVCVDGRFPDAKASLKGCARVHAAVSSAGNRLFLQPSFSQFELKGLKLDSGVNLDVAAPLITAVVKLLLQQINGVLQAQPVVLNVNAIRSIDPEELKKDPRVTSVVGAAIPVNVALGNTAVLIDDAGVHLLGTAVALTPARIKATVASLRLVESVITTAPLTGEQVALLSECNTFPADGSADYADYHRICDAYAKRAEKPVPEDGHTKPEEMRRAFGELQKSFRSAADAIQSDPALPWKTTAVALSKTFLATAVNEFTKDATYGVRMKFVDHYEHFNEELRTDKFSGLACDIDYSCDQTRSCDPNWPCEGRGCPSDCAWYDAGCQAWKPVCEALKAAERAGCEADKVRYRNQCEAEKATARAACELKKAADKLGCETNKAWLQLVSETNIGRLEGTVKIETGWIEAGLRSFRLGADLGSISAAMPLGGEATLVADLNFTPWDLAHLVCPARWTARINARVQVEASTLDIGGPVEPASESDGTLVLSFKPAAQNVWLKFDKPPLLELFAQNPTVAISCGPASALGVTATTIAKAAHDLKPGNDPEEPISIFKNRFRYEVKDRVLPIRISPLEQVVGREADPDRLKVRIVPSWSKQTIVFTPAVS